jgi:hypothetical protein
VCVVRLTSPSQFVGAALEPDLAIVMEFCAQVVCDVLGV